ncbi:MAG TPA: hypothetical protein VMV57_08710 [Terracidiphilus sp.]|nr:hypothetical protein [Terracidiphilus sp.]
MTVPEGYEIHQSVDLGGHMHMISGSDAMYDTMVNIHSGPRMLGQTFEMRALPSNKHALIDHLTAFSSGFGGDPNNFAKMDLNKGKIYEFSGMFRRDRQYFDYDLLGNPNINTGLSIPIGPSTAPSGTLAWPQVNQSPVMFNTVRRMTDTHLTLFPLSKVTYRFGYSQNIFQGPTLSPSYSIFKYDALLQQYQRNSTDDFMGALDWKPVEGTKLTFETQVDHYKADSYFTLNPNGFMVQEADGTPVYLGNWDSQTPYGIGACTSTSMGSAYTSKTDYTLLSPSQTPGGMPIINPACAAVTSYSRTQPTRVIYPTWIVRLQSSSIRNVEMNGDVRYTLANMDMPMYEMNVQGISGTMRSGTVTGTSKGHRAVVAADYGIIWQVSPNFSLADQLNLSSVQQPGLWTLLSASSLNTPTDTLSSTGNETINYSGPLSPGSWSLPHGVNSTPTQGYFGQAYATNNLTASWDATPRVTLAFTYRYSYHKIGEGVPHAGPVDTSNDPFNGTVSITENGGILNATFRPTSNWELNGSVEALYHDNAFTPVGPRQTRHYRMHTIYRPRPWATISGAFNDIERHNNTNNNQADVAAGDAEYIMPIDHVDYARVASAGVSLFPNDHFGLDMNYAYSDVYTATNICYTSGAAGPSYPGVATLTSSGAPNVCPGVFARNSTTVLVDWIARDFMDAPTHSGSISVTGSPDKSLRYNLGYQISSVAGSQFFNDARGVNGSLNSNYYTPFVKLAWTVHPGLIWKAEYNLYGYSEGGPSGAKYCSTSTSYSATVVPCDSSTLTGPTGLTEPTSGLTAPRTFRANNVTLGLHYEF